MSDGFPHTELGEALPPTTRDAILAITHALVSGDDAVSVALRHQLAVADIVDVEYTGAGLYAHFAVPGDVPTARTRDGLGGTVHLNMPGLPASGGAMLGVRGGRLAFLEIYTYTHPLPEPLTNVEIQLEETFSQRDA